MYIAFKENTDFGTDFGDFGSATLPKMLKQKVVYYLQLKQ